MKRLYYGLGKRKFAEWILLAVFVLFFYGPLFNMLTLSFAGKYEYPDVIPQTYGLKWWDYILSKRSDVRVYYDVLTFGGRSHGNLVADLPSGGICDCKVSV